MALNVLVVDDSQTVRAIISKTLHLTGAPIGEIFTATNGAEALEVLKNQWVDLVLSDINMPVMGGVEMIDRMKQDDLLHSIPIVVVSTEGSKTRIEELLSKGVRAYIRKPFTPESIRNIIDDIIAGGMADGTEKPETGSH